MFLARVFFAADGFDDMLAIEDTDQAVNSGFIGQKLGLVTLYEATGDDDALAPAVFFHLDGVADFRHRLGFRGFEKTAGVDDDGVGIGGVGGDGEAIHRQQAEHPLAIDEVLRATKTDEGDRFDFFRTVLFGNGMNGGLFGHGKLRNTARRSTDGVGYGNDIGE